ncbi:GGDEF-domain containing protein [Mycolicibacterium arabiense]|uniref:GGDEF-domain containing protein n=2 Tax=Mycolicibacterium arabiense TaxID=1286181 RepID=A0A7I7RS21_9MYCO|nr:EAL domain-containing protein [Mycolicibacterium arabiense]BBY47317.1 GGDEF-domain containing protein [Mycolicibacterium arabiense]
MIVNGSNVRLGLFTVVAVLAWMNALALFGHGAAHWIAAVLQAGVGAGALVCAVTVARRVAGIARWWRLLVIAAMTSWLVGELFWWFGGTGDGANTAPLPGVVAYFMPPVLSLLAMMLLARSAGLSARRGAAMPHSRVIAGLDGLVAAVAFSILVLIAGLGAKTGAALPRSQNTTLVIAYSVLELIVVVLAVLMAMAYGRDRPYRANYLLLSGGVVIIAGSDRLIAYLRTAGVEGGDLWGGVGAILGPLLIAFSVLERQPEFSGRGGAHAMDWVQSVVPYIGFVAIFSLLAFHLMIGQRLTSTLICMALALIALVTTRQVVAMRAQQLLTQRLYEAQRRLAHQVQHDPLTGLPNRLLFAQRLDEALRDGRFVLIFVDIDDFKEVNDQYGHAAGDDLLCAVGARLKRCVGPSDTLARIGGDEFAVLVEGDDELPEVVADRPRVALRDPFAVHGSAVRVRASMGLVRPPSGEPTPTSDDLIRQADSSMYAGKRLGKNTAVVYRPSSGVSVDFPSALRQAKGGVPAGFRLVYQPVVSLPDGVPVAVEALARWTAPNDMQIPPETFVAVAEGAGLGAALDAMVLDVACREVRAAGLELDLHVNIGAARLGNAAFEQVVVQTLARHDIEAGRVVLEITETVPIVDLTAGAAAIRRLSTMGVKVALDDFGAGFNSLTYLHTLPVHTVKLDRSLAVGAEPDRDLALYRSVIGLCGSLGLDVIAEGIEHQTQADTVFAAGCRLAQGYLFGRATPLDQMIGSSSGLRTRSHR